MPAEYDRHAVYTREPTGGILITREQSQQIQIGDVVTVEYDRYGAVHEPPIGARVTRVRSDLVWENVLDDYQQEPLNNKNGMVFFSFVFVSSSLLTLNITERYTKYTKKYMRAALEAFALSKHKDPLVPQTWYTISRSSVVQSPVCREDGRDIKKTTKY